MNFLDIIHPSLVSCLLFLFNLRINIFLPIWRSVWRLSICSLLVTVSKWSTAPIHQEMLIHLSNLLFLFLQKRLPNIFDINDFIILFFLWRVWLSLMNRLPSIIHFNNFLNTITLLFSC